MGDSVVDVPVSLPTVHAGDSLSWDFWWVGFFSLSQHEARSYDPQTWQVAGNDVGEDLGF